MAGVCSPVVDADGREIAMDPKKLWSPRAESCETYNQWFDCLCYVWTSLKRLPLEIFDSGGDGDAGVPDMTGEKKKWVDRISRIATMKKMSQCDFSLHKDYGLIYIWVKGSEDCSSGALTCKLG